MQSAMIEFFFDCSSPWSYLAFRNIQPRAAGQHISISWRPVLVGGIFNTVNQRMYAGREDMNSPRNRYMLKDLQDCARQAGVMIEFPPKVFPVNSVKVMRGCLWLAENSVTSQKLTDFIEATFAAYFTQQADISQDDVIARIASQCGIDPAELAAGILQSAIKAQLKSNTDEAIARGAFGVPTLFVGPDMYFGNDRVDLAMAAAMRSCESQILN